MFRVKLYLIIVFCLLITSSTNFIMANSDPTYSNSIEFNTINGVSLYLNRSEILNILGIPQDIKKDEWMPEMMEYRYSNLLIGFRGEDVDYIAVPYGVDDFEVDGFNMEMSIAAIKSVLGEPDFIADDGIVFVRGHVCMKLFMFTGDTEVIDAVHIYSQSN